MDNSTTPQDDAAMSPASTGSTLLDFGLHDATVAAGLRLGLSAEEIACRLVEDKQRLMGRLVKWESTSPFKVELMLAALKRQQANIRRWLETGVPADAEESRSISEQIDAAITLAEGGR